MGKVATVFKVYIEQGKEQETLDKIKAELKPNSVQLDEVAFGIKIAKVMFIHEDAEGSEKFEAKLRNFPNVNEVEVADESLIS